MQTFFNEYTFEDIAANLDKKRLQKQLLEGRQILKRLLIPGGGWGNHPAVLQWKTYEVALVSYCHVIAEECSARGVKTETNLEVIRQLEEEFLSEKPMVLPSWWIDGVQRNRLIVTHRARLFVKNPVFYAKYEPFVELAEPYKCCVKCNYFWPSHHARNSLQPQKIAV